MSKYPNNNDILLNCCNQSSSDEKCCKAWENAGYSKEDYPQCYQPEDGCKPISEASTSDASVECCNEWKGQLANPNYMNTIGKACCSIKAWTDTQSNIGFCCPFNPDTSNNPQLASICGGSPDSCGSQVTYTLKCEPAGNTNNNQCSSQSSMKCTLTTDKPQCQTNFTHVRLKYQKSYLKWNNTTKQCDNLHECKYNGNNEIRLGSGTANLGDGVAFYFDDKCEFYYQSNGIEYRALENATCSGPEQGQTGGCSYISYSTMPDYLSCGHIGSGYYGTSYGQATIKCSHTFRKINGQWQ